MEQNSNDKLKTLFKRLPYLLALIGFFMFFYTIFGKEPPLQSLYWFLVIIAAFFLPYIKEITFQDIKLKLEEGLEKQQEVIEQTKEELQEVIKNEFDSAYDKVKRVDDNFGEIRDELIKGYQIYLNMLTEEERSNKIIVLNTIYLKDFNITIATLKEKLAIAGFYKGKINDQYENDLLNAIKAFQKSQGMISDGIFGHNSYKKLIKLINKK